MQIPYEDLSFDSCPQMLPIGKLMRWERIAVARGARLLDEVVVRWWTSIDLDNFACDSPTNDILGQLYGLWASGLQRLGIAHEAAAGFGFDTIIEISDPVGIDASYERLEIYWLEEIKERYQKCPLYGKKSRKSSQN